MGKKRQGGRLDLKTSMKNWPNANILCPVRLITFGFRFRFYFWTNRMHTKISAVVCCYCCALFTHRCWKIKEHTNTNKNGLPNMCKGQSRRTKIASIYPSSSAISFSSFPFPSPLRFPRKSICRWEWKQTIPHLVPLWEQFSLWLLCSQPIWFKPKNIYMADWHPSSRPTGRRYKWRGGGGKWRGGYKHVSKLDPILHPLLCALLLEEHWTKKRTKKSPRWVNADK